MDRTPLSPVIQITKPGIYSGEGYSLHEAIINAADLSIISTNLEGVITSFNRGAESILGYQAEHVVGKATLEIFHDRKELIKRTIRINDEMGMNITPGFRTFITPLVEKTSIVREEWTYVRKDGSTLPVMLTITPLFEEKGRVGYVAIASDISEQKRIEELHEQTQAQLQSIIASIEDIVFELDHHGRFINIWVKSDDFLFLPREKILGHTLSEMFGPDFAEPFEKGIQNVLKTGEPFEWEYPSLSPDDQRWFSATCSLIYEDGKPTHKLTVCIHDITDRKTIELSLRQSEEKFRLLAENVPGVVFILRDDETNSVLFVNNQIESITGHAVAEFTKGNIRLGDLIHEDDKPYVISLRSKSLTDRIAYQLEYRIRHTSGTWKWIEECGIGVYSPESSLIQGFITDITQRKQSDDELRRMADENSRIFNHSITLSAIATFEGYFTKLNPAWERTLGWTRDELVSHSFISFVHPDDVKKTLETLKDIATGSSILTFENRYRCKDGSYRWLLWNSSPDVDRKIIYASAIDITSRKKSEDELLMSKRNLEVAAFELEEQNRQLDEFAHIISHNLRAPVSNIKALLSFINEKSNISDYQLIFEKIKNVTHNIAETMNELLETIRIRKNHEIERVEIRFKDVLDKVVQSLEGELIESGATVTFNFNNAPKIYYSKPYLESILQNLLSNAIKYRSPSRIPEIIVTTDLVKNGIELRMQDNGLGIDLDQFGQKLFGLHKTFHENKEARGVGLFLTKTQVETLGGTITAESEVDRGTCFIIQF